MSTPAVSPPVVEAAIPADCPPILRHANFQEYVRQALNGMFIAAIQEVKKATRHTAGASIREFLSPEMRDQAKGLVNHFLQRYTQSICDDYCTSYGAIFDEKRVDLNTALNSDFDMDSYAFKTLSQIFEESRRAAKMIPEIEAAAATSPSVSLAGPLHLGCFTKCIMFELTPKLIPLILESMAADDISMSSSSRDNGATLSPAAKNILRYILNEHISKAFQTMRTDPKLLEEAKNMKFVCQPPPSPNDLDSHSPCDEGWDWQVIDEAKRDAVRRLEKEMWIQYREDVKNGTLPIITQQAEAAEDEDTSDDEEVPRNASNDQEDVPSECVASSSSHELIVDVA